jgi:hypothetical protein
VGDFSTGNEMTGTPQFSACAKSMFISHIYQRLPHPLDDLLKEVPVVDGTEVNLVWDFLFKAIHARRVSQTKDQLILQLLYPYY